ncbi:phage tail tape measure protein [Maridesulfovibrio frigidus]|uniref:phage tail tape measure protein n=1 Tax=Maridesulfovibrio frigidus TaxID=340956 RepID=UPI0004E17716|nr:phage tail tape measure protein [Maridesulfovibrio frigidus]
MASKKFSAVVEIGGAVKESLRSSIKVLGGDLSDVGDAVRDAKKKLDLLEKYDPQGVRKMGKEYRALRRDAAKLRKEYEATAKPTRKMAAELARAEAAAKKAGKAYKAGRDKLESMSKSLKKAGVSTHNLAGEHRRLSTELDKAKDKMDRLNRAMEAGGKMKSQIGSAARVGAGVAAGVGVIGAAVTMANKATGEQVALAASLGVSAEKLQAWGGIAKEAGFEVDTVGDLFEEMNNKLGESAGVEEVTAVKDGLDMLGLSYEEIKGLSPEEQFEKISKAMKDVPDQQQAVSAADMIFGGEANKFFGYIRSRKEGINALLAQQKRLNVMSDEGRAGASAYNTAFSHLTTVVGSCASEVSGLIGGALAPLVDEYGPKLADWVKSHKKDLIGIGDAVKNAIPGFLAFGRGIYTVVSSIGSVVSTVASLVGGFDNLAIIIGLAFGVKAAFGIGRFATNLFTVGKAIIPLVSSYFPAIVSGIRSIGLAVMANPIGLAIAAVIGVALLVWKYWDPICDFFCNIGSMIGDAVSSGFDFIKSIFMNFTPLGLVIQHWEPIKAWIGDLFGWIGDKASALFGGIGDAVSSVASFFGFGDDEEDKEKSKVRSKESPEVGTAVADSSALLDPVDARPEVGSTASGVGNMTAREKKQLAEADLNAEHFRKLAESAHNDADQLMQDYYMQTSEEEKEKAARIRDKYGLKQGEKSEVGVTEAPATETAIPEVGSTVSGVGNMTAREKKQLAEADLNAEHFRKLAESAHNDADQLMQDYYMQTSDEEKEKATRIRDKHGLKQGEMPEVGASETATPEVGAAKGKEIRVPDTVQPSTRNNNQRTQHNNIVINSAPGQSEEDIANLVVEKMNEQDRDNSRLAMHD